MKKQNHRNTRNESNIFNFVDGKVTKWLQNFKKEAKKIANKALVEYDNIKKQQYEQFSQYFYQLHTFIIT